MAVVPEPRLRARYSLGVISGWRCPEKNSTRVTTAMSAATQYWMTASRRVTDEWRVEATEVIITQLPAADAINATWINPTEILACAVSISNVTGGQLSAATMARLPSAMIIALLTTECRLTIAHPIRRPVAIPSRPAMTQTINQTPLRGGPAQLRRDRWATAQAGTAAAQRSPPPPARRPPRLGPYSRCAGSACS